MYYPLLLANDGSATPNTNTILKAITTGLRYGEPRLCGGRRTNGGHDLVRVRKAYLRVGQRTKRNRAVAGANSGAGAKLSINRNRESCHLGVFVICHHLGQVQLLYTFIDAGVWVISDRSGMRTFRPDVVDSSRQASNRKIKKHSDHEPGFARVSPARTKTGNGSLTLTLHAMNGILQTETFCMASERKRCGASSDARTSTTHTCSRFSSSDAQITPLVWRIVNARRSSVACLMILVHNTFVPKGRQTRSQGGQLHRSGCTLHYEGKTQSVCRAARRFEDRMFKGSVARQKCRGIILQIYDSWT